MIKASQKTGKSKAVKNEENKTEDPHSPLVATFLTRMDTGTLVTLESYITNFWIELEERFESEFLNKSLGELILNEANEQQQFTLPEFFKSHFKLKVIEYLQEEISIF